MAQDELQHVQALIAEGRLDEARAIFRPSTARKCPNCWPPWTRCKRPRSRWPRRLRPGRCRPPNRLRQKPPRRQPQQQPVRPANQEVPAPAAATPRAPTAPASGGAPGGNRRIQTKAPTRCCGTASSAARPSCWRKRIGTVPTAARPRTRTRATSRRGEVRRSKGLRLHRRGQDLPELRGAERRGGGILPECRPPDGCRPRRRARLRDAPGEPSFRRRK